MQPECAGSATLLGFLLRQGHDGDLVGCDGDLLANFAEDGRHDVEVVRTGIEKKAASRIVQLIHVAKELVVDVLMKEEK